MSNNTRAIELLQACIDDEEEEDSHFRFLVDKKTVKYVSIAAGLYTVDDLSFGPVLIPSLPEFPAGDWNNGRITRSSDSGKPSFAWTERAQLPTIESAWHPTYVDHLDLSLGEKLHSGVYEATTSKLPFPVVAKFGRFEWEIQARDDECMAYQWIDGQNIGPKFLGQIVEEGRSIGFIIEKIADARHATLDDLPACQMALAKLHNLGILHGDINKHNFLIKNGKAVLIDLECVRKCQNAAAFDEEMGRLKETLADTSARGGITEMASYDASD